MKHTDYTDRLFGHARVLRRLPAKIESPGVHRAVWELRCGCGELVKRSSAQLRQNIRRKAPVLCWTCQQGAMRARGRAMGRLLEEEVKRRWE
jgi:hypothetical protein